MDGWVCGLWVCMVARFSVQGVRDIEEGSHVARLAKKSKRFTLEMISTNAISYHIIRIHMFNM